MTFLEAMVLQRPIISTDLPSTRYVLKNNYGLLVENSQAGLEAGLRQFLEQGLPVRHFDADSYNRECLAEFERLINGPDN
jgi:CDP-glycerol glycerophosphotransferase